MSGRPELDCEAVDELAAAFSLGAVDAGEEHAVSMHLATCSMAHAETHALIGVGFIMPASLDPVIPSELLRARLMSTVAVTPQDHVPRRVIARTSERSEPTAARSEPRRRWWQFSALPPALAATALAAAVGFGAWGVTLNDALRQSDAALAALASADAVHPVSGEAGTGLLIEVGDTATFVAEDLAELPADRLYQFWLIDADGNPLPAGTLDETDGVPLVDLDRGLEGTTTFAVTLERTRVEAPTSAPILVRDLET